MSLSFGPHHSSVAPVSVVDFQTVRRAITMEQVEEATGTQYIHPLARFPLIIMITNQSLILTALTPVSVSALLHKSIIVGD
jgi:hypothetical protein